MAPEDVELAQVPSYREEVGPPVVGSWCSRYKWGFMSGGLGRWPKEEDAVPNKAFEEQKAQVNQAP